jgi:hypothetical protein
MPDPGSRALPPLVLPATISFELPQEAVEAFVLAIWRTHLLQLLLGVTVRRG